MLDEKLEYRNIKPTTMRVLVLKKLMESSTAISLSELEAKFDRADTSTLYRTLKTFEEKKLIHSINDEKGIAKYALCIEGCECEAQDQHVHFQCVKCQEIYCLTQTKIPETKIPKGFRTQSIEMIYKGICANC